MGAAALAVLRPGDWVSFDGGDHQVVAVAGTSVRLRSAQEEGSSHRHEVGDPGGAERLALPPQAARA
jgi:hypothetical protein